MIKIIQSIITEKISFGTSHKVPVFVSMIYGCNIPRLRHRHDNRRASVYTIR